MFWLHKIFFNRYAGVHKLCKSFFPLDFLQNEVDIFFLFCLHKTLDLYSRHDILNKSKITDSNTNTTGTLNKLMMTFVSSRKVKTIVICK